MYSSVDTLIHLNISSSPEFFRLIPHYRFRGELYGLGSNHTKYKGGKSYPTGGSERAGANGNGGTPGIDTVSTCMMLKDVVEVLYVRVCNVCAMFVFLSRVYDMPVNMSSRVCARSLSLNLADWPLALD